MTRFLSAALSVLLASNNLTPLTAQNNVCGVDYSDAADNCLSNPACPLGDGCPPGKQCFSIPANSPKCIPGPPTPPPTPMLMVCGSSSDDAAIRCPDTNQHCPTGDGCPDGMACFVTPFELCGATTAPTTEPTRRVTESPVEAGPTHSPTQGPYKVCGSTYADATTNCLTNTKCPTGDGCETGSMCFALPHGSCVDPSAVEDVDVVDTPDPMPPMQGLWKVCGSTYADATTNCWDNPKCPTGDGCASGTMCYALPEGSCPAPEVTPDPTPEPTPAPTPDPTPAPVPAPVPTLLGVCGTDYNQATVDFCANPKCPTGDGCPTGMVCYSLPYNNCEDAAQEDTTQTLQATIPAPTPPPTDMAVVVEPATIVQADPLPQSPVYNTLYCGSDYNDATENCWTNTPCPSGGGCPSGHNCYPITTDRCMSDAPTSASPTAPTLAPSPEPTESPVPNMLFCGTDYSNAMASCSEGTACPSGAGCPGDMNCFAGIMCPATASSVGGGAVAVPEDNEFFCGTDYSDATASCSQGTACPSGFGCPSDKTCFAGIMCPPTAPVVEEANAAQEDTTQTLPATDAPTPAPTPPPTDMAVVVEPATIVQADPLPQTQAVNNLYCGSDYNDATENCWTNTPCPSGGGCPSGHNCYPISIDRCMSDAPTPNPSASPTTPTQAPSPEPTESPVANTYFCGTDYMDAFARCSEEGRACPSGAGCLGDAMCFVGIMCPAAVSTVNEEEQVVPEVVPEVVEEAVPEVVEEVVPQALQTYISHTTLYCGSSWEDATTNCHTNTPCPQASREECPNGQNCYPTGLCSVPPETPESQTDMGETEPTIDQQANMNKDRPQSVEMQAHGGAEAVMGPTAEEPTSEKAAWSDFSQYTYDGSSDGSPAMYGGIFAPMVLLGAVILGAL